MSAEVQTLETDEDLKEMLEDGTVIIQNSPKAELFSELFYTSVVASGSMELRGMLDSGYMACTLSKDFEQSLLAKNIV